MRAGFAAHGRSTETNNTKKHQTNQTKKQAKPPRRAEATNIFFRPTPYGFRQVVQHVSKHVAYEIN